MDGLTFDSQEKRAANGGWRWVARQAQVLAEQTFRPFGGLAVSSSFSRRLCIGLSKKLDDVIPSGAPWAVVMQNGSPLATWAPFSELAVGLHHELKDERDG